MYRAKKILDHFGKTAQEKKVIEELNELKIAIYNGQKVEIIDEMADVLIMIEQLRLMYDISDKEINRRKAYKLDRTLKRIRNGHYKKEETSERQAIMEKYVNAFKKKEEISIGCGITTPCSDCPLGVNNESNSIPCSELKTKDAYRLIRNYEKQFLF